MKPITDFAKIPLGVFPTPIQKLENISRQLGTNVYIKRDDLTGLGLGGNKVRKLEFLMAQAKAEGAELVFTTGGAQSNHAMLTAAAAGKLGMKISSSIRSTPEKRSPVSLNCQQQANSPRKQMSCFFIPAAPAVSSPCNKNPPPLHHLSLLII